MRKTRFGIREKIIAIMLAVTIIPIALIGFITYKSSSKMMTDQYRELGQVIGREITDTVKIKMDDMENALKNLVLKDSELFLETSDEDSLILNRDLKSLVDTYNALDAYFVNKSEVTQSDKIDEGFFSKVVDNTGSEGTVWSDIREGDNGFYVTMGEAVYDENDLLGVVSVDVPVSVFDNILSEKRIGKGGFPILIDSKNTKLALKDTDEIGIPFKGADKFENMKGTQVSIRNSYMRGDEVQDQFMIVDKVDDTGWKLITIVPINNIKERTSQMLKTVVLVGAITTLLGLLTAVLFSKSIITPINKILSSLGEMEKGDFRERISIKNRDELGEFRDGFNSMMVTLSSLINHIKRISEDVSISSETLAAVAEQTSASAEEISKTSDEIARGASKQAEETECSSRLINNLSQSLGVLGEDSSVISDFVVDVNSTIDESRHIVDDLGEKTDVNTKNTEKVSVKIHNLDKRISEISTILSTIDQIAEQTNLLALNAGIEAARAGEFGKGFAVVAEEIRKLAKESKDSSRNISDIIESVQEESKETVEVMDVVKDTNHTQSEIVKKVNDAFLNLSGVIESITEKISSVTDHIDDINGEKEEVVRCIDSILSVSEDTAAASEEVSASIEQQTQATGEVAKAAEKLNELSQNLNHEISKFKS